MNLKHNQRTPKDVITWFEVGQQTAQLNRSISLGSNKDSSVHSLLFLVWYNLFRCTVVNRHWCVVEFTISRTFDIRLLNIFTVKWGTYRSWYLLKTYQTIQLLLFFSYINLSTYTYLFFKFQTIDPLWQWIFFQQLRRDTPVNLRHT